MPAPADFEAFCHREYARLVGFLDLYLDDSAGAEDIAQEALLRAAQRWERVSALESPGGWLHRVAVNLANSRFRRRAAGRRANDRLGRQANARQEDPDIAERHTVRQAVARLPERQRRALILRYYLGLPAGEVGVRLGCTAQAVRALTKRALSSLRAELGGSAVEQDEEVPDAR